MEIANHFEAAYPKLHALAERLFRRQPSTSTLQATALVHEVYLRFARLDPGAPTTEGEEGSAGEPVPAY